ncbi:LysE family transporter [Shimazuella alba]|jgi:threonine/homoserine/homoserine lactone efflux protein|uniref:LysE family transporter n=1 Tax=Shimazuella alba TaxID=2690964 RepID=A0A6I4W3F5_9BACL|nr:LysE family transporter [Shimazuella alba]MXQ54832.1 LysE family transporter [Shimazuella alba]
MPVLSFFLYVFVTSFTPGPNNIMGMAFGSTYGLKKSIRFCSGVGIGYFLVMLLCCYLNLLLEDIIPNITFAMSILGGIYMLYLAYKIVTSKDSKSSKDQKQDHIFFTAILLQFVNPKGILSGITLVTTFILPYYHSNISFILFALLIGFIGFLSTFSWSLFGSVFQKFLSAYRTPFNIVMALSLVYISISIFIKS